MNPWQFLRREVGGTIRSIRYDWTIGRNRRRMQQDTMELPVIGAAGAMYSRKRRRVVLATGSALVAAAGISGYLAVSSGLDALVGGGGSPGALPGTTAKPRPSGAQVNPVTPGPQVVPAAAQTGNFVAPPKAVPIPEKTTPMPSISPPVPTPAPTCNCPAPSPTPTPSTTPSPSASPSQSASPSPSPSPSAPAAE